MSLVDTSALSSGKDARLAALVSRGYAYRLYAPSVDVVMGQHGLLCPDALSVQVQVPNEEVSRRALREG